MTKRKASIAPPAEPTALLGDIRALIEASHQRAALAVNTELTHLFWRVGQRIHTDVLAGQRAEYGAEILRSLAAGLVRGYGRSFTDKNLRRMVQFPAAYPDERIVVSLSREFGLSRFFGDGWSHPPASLQQVARIESVPIPFSSPLIETSILRSRQRTRRRGLDESCHL